MGQQEHFRLIRLSDDLVYEFDYKETANQSGYKRRDQDLWITYKDNLGWVAHDTESEEVLGKPWEIMPEFQNPDCPPEGIWVSRKGFKSYVYELKYKNNE